MTDDFFPSYYRRAPGFDRFAAVCAERNLDPRTVPYDATQLIAMLCSAVGALVTMTEGDPGLLAWLSAALDTHARIADEQSEAGFKLLAHKLLGEQHEGE